MISQDNVATVRDRADLSSIVGETVKLARRGRSLVGLCPFHKEKTPSFHVNPERNHFHCFGCHEHGDAIAFVMKMEGLEFTEAVRALADRFGITIDETHDPRAEAQKRAARRVIQDLYEVSNLAATFFEEQLRTHPDAKVAREELARRGLTSQEPTDAIANALQAFRVGYAPAGWDALATHFTRHGVSPASAETVGLLVPRKGAQGHYDRFRNRLMFAVLDVQGRVVAFSGRVLADPQTGEVDKQTGKYINSPESPIYRKGDVVFGLYQARQQIREQEQVIVVEGNFDVVSLHAQGMLNVVAPLGTAFTSSQAKLVRRFAPQAVLLFDGDNAGREAARKSRNPCKEAGLDTRVATLPDGLDPDEFIRERGLEALTRLVAASRGMLEHLIDLELDKEFSGGDAHQRASRVQRVAHLLAEEDDPTVRAMAKCYADTVAARLGIVDDETYRAVHAVVRQALGGRNVADTRDMTPYRARSTLREESIPLLMLGCVIDYPEILGDPNIENAAAFLEGDIALAVGSSRLLCDKKESSKETFLAHLSSAIHDFASQRLARPVCRDAGEATTEFLQNAQKLKQRGLSREHAAVAAKVDRAWAQGDLDQENVLLTEAVRKAREKLGL